LLTTDAKTEGKEKADGEEEAGREGTRKQWIRNCTP
jgi:hypothetical protein